MESENFCLAASAGACTTMVAFGAILFIELLCEWILNIKSVLKDSSERRIVCLAAFLPVIFIAHVLLGRLDLLPFTFIAIASFQTVAYTCATYTVLLRVYSNEFKTSTFSQIHAITTLFTVFSYTQHSYASIVNCLSLITVITMGGFFYSFQFGRIRNIINNHLRKPFSEYSFEEVYSTSYLWLYACSIISLAAVSVSFAIHAIHFGIFIYSAFSSTFIILSINLPAKLAKNHVKRQNIL